MKSEIEKMFADANKMIQEERNSPESVALREIIKIEREHHYNKGTSHARMWSLREIIAKHSAEEQT
jgi:hypothetical protein